MTGLAGHLVFFLCLLAVVIFAALPGHANEDTGAPIAPTEAAPAAAPVPAPASPPKAAPPSKAPVQPAVQAAHPPARVAQVASVAAPGTPGMPVAPAAPSTPAPTGTEADGPAVQLEAMVATLEDADARARLVEQLKILIAAQKGQPPGATEEDKGKSGKPQLVVVG